MGNSSGDETNSPVIRVYDAAGRRRRLDPAEKRRGLGVS